MGRIILLLLLVCASSAQAQVNIGLSGILNRIGISGDAPEGSAWAANFGFGGALHLGFDVASDVEVMIEPEFTTRSSALQYTIPIESESLISQDTTVDSAYVRSQWIGIPLGLRIYSGSHRWFLATGVTPYLLSSMEIDTLTATYKPNNAIKSFDLALFIGVGYRVPVGPLAVAVEVRYNQGVLDLVGDEQTTSFRSSPVIRMGGFQARLAAEWRFSL